MNYFSMFMSMYAMLQQSAASPIVAKIEAAINQIIEAVLTKQESVMVAGYKISASLAASPSALTLAMVIAAVEKIIAGQMGEFQVGEVVVDVQKVA